MCILLKLHYAKFDVARLFCSKVSEENFWGVSSTPPPPPLGKGRVNLQTLIMGWKNAELQISQFGEHTATTKKSNFPPFLQLLLI